MLAASKFRGNTWSAWSETTPRHRAFIDAMLRSPMHIIVTMRSKTETVQGEGKKGHEAWHEVGSSDGVEYEFTHRAWICSTKPPYHRHQRPYAPIHGRRSTGDHQRHRASLMDWLNSGKADKTITPAQRDSLQDLMAEAGVPMLPVSALNAVCKVC